MFLVLVKAPDRQTMPLLGVDYVFFLRKITASLA